MIYIEMQEEARKLECRPAEGCFLFGLCVCVRETDSDLYCSMCMLTPSVVLKRAEISVKSCTRVK